MNSLLKLIILLVIVLFLFHLKKYKEYTENYEIEQQELDYVIGNNIYDILNPLVITFIEKGSLKKNVDEYYLFSHISVHKTFNNFITPECYLQHTNEILLIRSKKQITIELVNPKYLKYFKKNGKNLLNKFKLPEKNYSSVSTIDLVAREYNIIYIPRFWLFKFSKTDITIELFSSDNIFTYCFNFFH